MENYTIEEKHKLLIGGIEVWIRSHGFGDDLDKPTYIGEI